MEGDPARLVYLLILGLVIGLGIVASRQPWARLFRDVAIWGLIFAMVVIAYGFRDTLRRELFPASMTQLEGGSISLGRASNGHFQVDIFVNEEPVRFLVDTGASDIVLSRRDAAAAGLDPDTLTYSQVAATANGRVATAPVRLDRMRLGELVDENVPASVNSGQLDVSLLGMRYLSRFSRIEITGDEMILHQ